MRIQLHPRLRHCIIAASLSVIGACTVVPLEPALVLDTAATAPVLDGFGASTMVPSQGNAAARTLFGQGMAQAYAFNEAEAVRSFKAALAKDPECGLCAWGVAYQMGPTINSSRRGDFSEAKRYVDYALKHRSGASARDVALFESLAVRYAHGAASSFAPPAGAICTSTGMGEAKPGDPLDVAYAERLRALAASLPDEPDVLTLYTEAELIATRGRWDSAGKPVGRIGIVTAMVEAGLAKYPDHVGLNHYMIHIVDAVPVAARASLAADRLGKLAPKSPHLLHMPAHTYAHLGRYAEATRVNQAAVLADELMIKELAVQKFGISKDWRMHNGHFQWYAALMEGRGTFALESARALAKRHSGDNDFLEYVRSLPILTLVHLQRWDEVLKEAAPSGERGVAAVLTEMARGIALARTGKLADAKAALLRLDQKAEVLNKRLVAKDWASNSARSLSATAQAQLGAEIAMAEQRTDDAVALQAKAVAAADNIEQAEPPLLAGRTRNRLGEMQLEAKKFSDAERSFRLALNAHPKNGWSLQGLGKALAAQGKQADASVVQRDLDRSWVSADSQIRTQ